MVEYLLNAIRATAGEEFTVIANIAENGEDITEGCGFMFHTGNTSIRIPGEYVDGLWYFTIPADVTNGLKGRYWYCLYKDGNTLCFKEPIYLV